MSTERIATTSPEACGAPDGDAVTVKWTVPPAQQGQIVERAYALDEDGMVYERTRDTSDGRTTYRSRPIADGEDFEPWNGKPAGF